MYINNPGHMTKMAAMSIYGKNPSKIFFSGTGGPISTKLGMKHQWLKYYNVYILFSIICKHVYLYIQQISGERLQDHWSSGVKITLRTHPLIWR